MTSWPNWTDPQFLDALGVGGMNAAEVTVSGSVASAGSGAWAAPGLIAPEAMTVAFSGLVATIGLPQPWGLVASSGAVVRAHGTQTGTDTTNYSVNFTSLVPASGSLTAYLAATIAQIQQDPFPIPGPPPGDPAYNPNFVPTVGYATNQFSVALSAASGGINNTTTFELFRTVLTAGQSSITTYSAAGQVRAGNRKAWPAAVLASGGVLSQAQAQTILSPSVSGLTHTLPLVSAAGGLLFGFVNGTNGAWTVAASGTDTFVGLGVSGVSTLPIPASSSALAWGNTASGTWQIMASSPGSTPHGSQIFTGNGSFTVPVGVYLLSFVDVYAAGGGGGGSASGGGASGGGAGAYAIKRNISVLPGQIYTITVGVGGTPGNAGGANLGANGGISTAFGMMCVGGGGGTGAGTGQAGAAASGGGASGGDENLSGSGSQSGFNAGGTYFGGAGGAAPFGSVTSSSNGSAFPGMFPGGGGAGGANGFAGGVGAAGYVRVAW